MRKTENATATPIDVRWVQLAVEQLDSAGLQEWIELARRFQPASQWDGEQRAAWLREGIERKSLGAETHVLRTDERMLGFLAVSEVQVRISKHDRPIFELHRQVVQNELEAALKLSHVARDRSTDFGFGHMLFDYAVALALSRPPIVAVCVQPDNDGVSLMWQRDYHLREMDKPEIPGLLYFPIGPKPIPRWP